MTKKLESAQQALAEKRKQVNPRYKPAWHASVPAGWLNDPNGFCAFDGKVHLFYQYHPYDTVWGPMHWGHWTSEDMLHWQEQPVAMAPDTPADEGGCFSGSALIDNGEMVLIYTGLPAADETGRHLQQQCMAVCRDGVHVEKYAHNPIVGKDELPADGDPYDFRDPNVQKKGDEYRIVVANRGQNGGRMLAYRSRDLRSWRLSNVYADGLGTMCECPGVFDVDGKTVMIVCVMGADQTKYPCRQPVVYMVGHEEDDRLVYAGDPPMVDHGLDFYAPQVTRLPDGRLVMIGWALAWGHVSPTHTLGHGWAGMMSMPREVSLSADGALCQRPVEEIKRLRRDEVSLTALRVSGEVALDAISGDRREIDIQVDMTAADSVTLSVLKTQDECFAIRYDKATATLRVDRSLCGYPCTEDLSPEQTPYAQASVPLCEGKLRLQVFVDVSIVEVFADQGRKVLTSLAFPKGDAAGVSLSAEGGEAVVNLTSWALA